MSGGTARVRTADRVLVDLVRESPVDRGRRDVREIASEVAVAIQWIPGAIARAVMGSHGAGK